MPVPDPSPRLVVALLTIAVAVLLSSVATYVVVRQDEPVTTTGGTLSSSRANATSDAASDADAAQAARVAPARVRIPTLSVDSSLERLWLDDSWELQRPSRWREAGWFAGGTAPGALGTAVLSGHVDAPTGNGVFAGLRYLGRGDVVEVERVDGEVVEFTVDRLLTVPRDDFPTAEVYGATADAQLRLITCTGPYDDEDGYRDNLVVFASLR